MGALITSNGCQRVGVQASQATSGSGPTYNAARQIQVGSIDDRAVAFVAGDTTLGSPANEFDAAFDSTPTRTGQTIAHTFTVPTGSGNFGVRRAATHDDTATNVTGSSATLVSGVDSQLLNKTTDFALAITQNLIYIPIAGTPVNPATVTTQGLQRIGVQASQATSGSGPTYSASRQIQTGSIDDSSTAIAAGTTTLGSPTNEFDVAFDAVPTRSGQTIAHLFTIPTGSGNFATHRIFMHDDTPTNVTGTSTTVVSGIDVNANQLTKTSDFSETFTLNHIYSNQ